jgi:hypothetical protein
MRCKSLWKTVLFIAAMSLASLPAKNRNALADDYRCESTVGQVPKDNVYVPPGASCTLNGTRVEGNITVDSNASLYANTVHVVGNIQTVGAATRVNVSSGSFVGGSIQIKQSGAADISGVDINSDLLFDDNIRSLNAAGNIIGGNLQAFQNTGGVSIFNNRVGGNLQCKENVPAPTGGGNVVEGSMEDQCANFDGTPPVPPPPPSGQNCTGTLGAVTVDNLDVPPGATCTLNSTRVSGNIKVYRNATLDANAVRVDGNIQTDGAAARVNVSPGSFVGGSIQIFGSGAADIRGVDIDGDLQFDDNTRSLNAADNTIGGNLQAFYNTGGLSITGNTIDGNLQCKENVPPPTGENNIVKGSMEDQCTNFGRHDLPFMFLLLNKGTDGE